MIGEVERNWAGNVVYSATTLERPTSIHELRSIILSSSRVHVVGTRHSFNDIADADRLVALDGLPGDAVVDAAKGTVELNPAMSYGRLVPLLHRHGVALHNLASLPHISVGGAIATGTHGSGDSLGNLATAVSAMEIMRSDGELVCLERGDPDFDGAVVSLGALGAVVRIRLDVEPEYQIAQHVIEGLRWGRVIDDFDAITDAGHSVSLFTTWHEVVEQMWVKQRVPCGAPAGFGGVPAAEERHPIGGLSPDSCTPQRGLPGLWSDRLAHFRLAFTPSSGDELQSELLLPRAGALGAFEALRRLAADMEPHLLISEIRTVAADGLWMSPQHERDTVAIHCTWRPHVAEVTELIGRIERELAASAPRPHWGKLFTVDPATLARRYPRHADFVDLVSRYDPRGVFRNRWLDRIVLG
jgi:xylitol oxidase